MELLDKRIAGICNELRKLRVKQKLSIEKVVYKKGNYLYPGDAEAAESDFVPFDARNMHWYGPDQHYWFRAEYTVPEELDQKAMWLHVRTQIDEWDDGKNPQFLLFVNGEAVQGLDMNHREVLLKSSAAAGETLCLDLQSYTGTLHSEFNLILEMWEVDADIEKLYYDLWVPLSAFNRMDKDSMARIDLERVLNNTVNLLDLRTPWSQAFYDSLKEADNYLAKALYEDMAGYDEIIATCIGHTHIDVAWWWTVEQTREKTARSFATVLKLMEEYPEYRFMSSQPQLYVFLKERYPALYDKLKQRVAEKRWEPEGGMWVEADCNLTSGESLVRQFIHGKRFFKEEFGVDNRILWLPDVFGYSGALPQIMKKCGIDYFMTTKLSWNQFNKVPHDTLLWRGIDGSEVLTHFVTTLGTGQPKEDFFTTYNGNLHPDALMGGWERYQNKDINHDILISYGYGDGGGGPTRQMLEVSKRMEKGIKGMPRVRQEFAGVYFAELEERVSGNKRLPVWEGEFYFEYHRGTLTSMARNKRSNRKEELRLMDLELISVLAGEQMEYPAEELDQIWKTVLINQFHDILPGSSIREVYEVTRQEYEWVDGEITRLLGERLDLLTSGMEDITVYNTLGIERDDIVVLKECTAKMLTDEDGNCYPIQETEEGGVAYVKGLPSKGYKTFRLTDTAQADTVQANTVQADTVQMNTVQADRAQNNMPVQKVMEVFDLVNDRHLETPFYTVSFDEDGMISRIYDKEYDREVIQEGQRGNLLRMYEDKPIYYDNWDIDIYYTEKFWDVTKLDKMEWTELGPVRAALRIERTVSNSVICQDIYFYSRNRRIDFKTWVDWKEHQHLLKVHFPVAVHTDEASFDIQFGSLTRKTHSNTSWDMARFESCGQKWMDLSEGHYGVSLLNDCKYGHSVKDSNMALTLIKSGIEPNPVTDQEEHIFTYAIYPHGETWRAAGTVAEGNKLNQPVLAALGAGLYPENAGTGRYSLASVDRNNVVLETIKQAEDGTGIIVRMYESENALTKAKLQYNGKMKRVVLCNLIEEELEILTAEGNEIPVVLKPYEVVTLKIITG